MNQCYTCGEQYAFGFQDKSISLCASCFVLGYPAEARDLAKTVLDLLPARAAEENLLLAELLAAANHTYACDMAGTSIDFRCDGCVAARETRAKATAQVAQRRKP